MGHLRLHACLATALEVFVGKLLLRYLEALPETIAPNGPVPEEVSELGVCVADLEEGVFGNGVHLSLLLLLLLIKGVRSVGVLTNLVEKDRPLAEEASL